MLARLRPHLICGQPARWCIATASHRAILGVLTFSIGGLIATFWLVPAAGAITRGQVAPPNLGGCVTCNIFQQKTVPSAPSYRVPAGRWTIKRWSAQGGDTAPAETRLRVYRPTKTAGRFKLIGQSHTETVPADASPKFDTKLRVRRGDRLGIRTSGGAPAGYDAGGETGNVDAILTCDPTAVGQLVGAGTACPLVQSTNGFVNMWAKLRKR
jgi:hypothetical protein